MSMSFSFRTASKCDAFPDLLDLFLKIRKFKGGGNLDAAKHGLVPCKKEFHLFKFRVNLKKNS